jgi:hypothetical protein
VSIQSVYKDTSRPDLYGAYLWKVEHEVEYAHADTWFPSLLEALEYALEQETREHGWRTRGLGSYRYGKVPSLPAAEPDPPDQQEEP